MNYREWLRTATEDDIAKTLCEIQGRGGCGGCVGVNYTGSDGTCSGKPGEAVRKWLRAEKEPFTQLAQDLHSACTDAISRQAAIDLLKQMRKDGDMVPWEGKDVFARIRKLPSAQPEQRWIPCEERLPEEPFGCLVTVWDTNPVTMDEIENILPYFVGWDGEQWNDYDGEQCPFEIIAWMPLPEPYKESDR